MQTPGYSGVPEDVFKRCGGRDGALRGARRAKEAESITSD